MQNKDFPSFSLENSQFYANSKESIKLSPRKQLVFRRRGKLTIRRSIVGDDPVSILPPITSLLNGIRASFPISHQSEPIHSWKRIKGFSPFLNYYLLFEKSCYLAINLIFCMAPDTTYPKTRFSGMMYPSLSYLSSFFQSRQRSKKCK